MVYWIEILFLLICFIAFKTECPVCGKLFKFQTGLKIKLSRAICFNCFKLISFDAHYQNVLATYKDKNRKFTKVYSLIKFSLQSAYMQ